ncbi:YIP1 family protein [Leptospira yasudae]|uniref:Yip1 family protein n=1 Tax=Leptospira yasudae TaxID=2202201 RepID=UPI0010842DDE|nr:Yip1 family protein [Leptospira yasudae]TGK27719.1 YIP1 family protein [Leptospira yasudae]TGM06843.1 YIP1 family protein [Leptospira yasudae]
MFQFSFSFLTVLEEARDVLIRPVSFFKELSKAPEESLIPLYLRSLIFMGFLYGIAVLSMTVLTPDGFSNPPLSFLFLEMPLAYFLASFIIFPTLGFLYMFFSWICGGDKNWKSNFRASTAVLGIFWVALLLQSFGGLIHPYLGIGLGIAFTAYVPILFYLALTSYLKAPVQRTAIVLTIFAAILLYLQYSKVSSYINDYKMIENMNSHKPLTREEEEHGEQEAAEIIRKAMEKAKAEGHETQE